MTTRKNKFARRNGEPTQVSVHLHIDKELYDHFISQPNRSRYVNGLIKADMLKSE